MSMGKSQIFRLGEFVDAYAEEFEEIDVALQLDTYDNLFNKQSGCASDSTMEPEVLDYSESESTGGEKINELGNMNPGSETRQRRGFKNKKLEPLQKRKGIRNQKLTGGVVRSSGSFAGKETQTSQPCAENMPLPKWYSPCDGTTVEKFGQSGPWEFISTTEALGDICGIGAY
jgi:hypothetical protein